MWCTVIALDPKELTLRFHVGRAGDGEGQLRYPVDVAAHGDLLAVADAGESTHRVSIFTLRGTFLRHVGERPSKFSSGARPGQFIHAPRYVAMSENDALFVLEQDGCRVHVLNAHTGGESISHT